MSYYNTNRETGSRLRASETQAQTQEQRIQAFFESHSLAVLPPHEVHRRVLQDSPLTSVRRALTNLTTAGVLEKTTRMTHGTYGKEVHCWRLAS